MTSKALIIFSILLIITFDSYTNQSHLIIINLKKEEFWGSRSASETMGDKLHRREGNSPDHQLRPLNDRSVIKEVGVQRQPGGLPRSSHP